MPLIVGRHGQIRPDESNELICHVDMLTSFAALTGQKLSETAGPDSYNVLKALLGERTGRNHLVEQSVKDVALCQGTWKLVPGQTAVEGMKQGKSVELYDLATDLGETKNLEREKLAKQSFTLISR